MSEPKTFRALNNLAKELAHEIHANRHSANAPADWHPLMLVFMQRAMLIGLDHAVALFQAGRDIGAALKTYLTSPTDPVP